MKKWKDFLAESKTLIEFAQYWENRSIVPFGEEPDLENEHKYGYITLNEDGTLNKVIDRTNPNRKWDWYQIGGRWTGYFKPKENALSGNLGKPAWCIKDDEYNSNYADNIQIKDIDIEGMQETEKQNAHKIWDKIDNILQGEEMPSWSEFKEKYTDLDLARKAYAEDERVIKLDKDEDFRFNTKGFAETFGKSREEYVNKQAKNTLVPFAVVDEQGWHEKGEMGWWGMSYNEMETQDWQNEFWNMINNLPPDSWLTLVDCHI